MSVRRLLGLRRATYSTFDYRAHRISVWNSAFALPQSDERLALDSLTLQAQQTALGARVNGSVVHVKTPIASGDIVEPVAWDFEDDDAKRLLWHSSAHLLGDAIEQHFPDPLLCDGPPLLDSAQGGFFYEFASPATVSPRDFEQLQDHMQAMAKRKRKFEWLSLSMAQARDMFHFNPFKLEILNAIEARGESVTVYRCGDFIDLCKGPHVPNTGRIKWMKLLGASVASAKLQGVDRSVHRIYGMAFPTVDEGKLWESRREELERRDHRVIGQRQNLLMFSDSSPGSAFFLPDGAHIYNRLLEYLRHQYHLRGFDEVITPVLFQKKLWETSGHWDHYKDDMFFVKGDEKEPEMGLKPMNCPSHCLIFGHKQRSHRELPLRFADFGVLHRNEQSGALSGLTRVRKFQQDDAHIFCREEQLEEELMGCLDFLKVVYNKLGFGESFSIRLATRPVEYVGEDALWDLAESTLRKTLDSFGQPWTVAEGDGSFYGPKLDVVLRDALGRIHQCGTIQLDFQLPRRFGLHYVAEDGSHDNVPVMIHRAILGSGERMFAILTENCAGKWPAWINPRLVAVLPVADAHREYSQEVLSQISASGARAFLIDDGNTLKKRIRAAQLAQYSYILVLGDVEQEDGLVSVRHRDSPEIATESLIDFVARVQGQLKF